MAHVHDLEEWGEVGDTRIARMVDPITLEVLQRVRVGAFGFDIKLFCDLCGNMQLDPFPLIKTVKEKTSQDFRYK